MKIYRRKVGKRFLRLKSGNHGHMVIVEVSQTEASLREIMYRKEKEVKRKS